MDIMSIKTRISEWVKQYKYVGVVLLVGILLMLFPGRSKNESVARTVQQVQQPVNSVETRLEEILGYIKGAGDVKVLLSTLKGEQIIYQTDSTYAQKETGTDTKTQTILITDSQRNEAGLIHQKNPPIYQGAVILAQGADDPVVKLAIVEAVSNITGLGADRISVIKMQ